MFYFLYIDSKFVFITPGPHVGQHFLHAIYCCNHRVISLFGGGGGFAGLVQLDIAGLPLRSCRTIGAPSV